MTMTISGSTGLEFPDGSDQTSAFTGNAAAITTGVLAQTNGGTGTTIGYNGFKNRIINGAMMIDQRNAGASVTVTSQYTLDRWYGGSTQSSKYSVQQNAGSVTPPVGFVNYLGVTSSSAYSVLTSDTFWIQQPIEGTNVSDFGWGTANAATVTLSFWVRSSLTGTFGGAFTNSAINRSYAFSYTISVANTWEQKTITVAGDTSGTWLTTNGSGIIVRFGLGSGSTYTGTADSWQAANLVQPTGSVSVVGTSGATFYITGVQLEKGSTATSFDYLDYGRQLQQCQRYYWKTNTNMGFAQTVNITGGGVLRTPVTMRASPTTDSGAIFQVSTGNAGTVGLLNSTGFAVSPDGVVPYNTAVNWSISAGVQFIGALTAEL